MNKTSHPLREGLNSSWSVQIYDGNRRLLFSLYPSHGWAFLTGAAVGLCVMLIGLESQIAARSSTVSAPVAAPLSLD